MTVSVLLFGPQAQLVGERAVQVQIEGTRINCTELRTALAKAAPVLTPSLSHSWFAVNHAYASEDQQIGPDDEVALIGMVSGG